MAIKINNETVINDSREFILDAVNFSDSTSQNSAISGNADGEVLVARAGDLIKKFLDVYSEGYNDQFEFGYSVAVSDRFIAIGANTGKGIYFNEDGVVYIYDANTYEYLYAISIYPVGPNKFGTKVAIDNNLLAVAAPQQSYGIGLNGSVYIFDLDNNGGLIWRVDGGNNEEIGSHGLSICGNNVAFTANYNKFYVYTIGNSTPDATITVLDGTRVNGVPSNIAHANILEMNETYVVFGDPGYNISYTYDGEAVTGYAAGRVIVYSRVDYGIMTTILNPRTQQDELLLNSNGITQNQAFGAYISLSDNNYLSVVGPASEGNFDSVTALYKLRGIENHLAGDLYTKGTDVMISTDAYNSLFIMAKLSKDGSFLLGTNSSSVYSFDVSELEAASNIALSSNWWSEINGDAIISGLSQVHGFDVNNGVVFCGSPTASPEKLTAYAYTSIYDLYGVEEIIDNSGNTLSYDDSIFQLYKRKFELEHTYDNPDTVNGYLDQFGYSVKVHGKYTFIGAYKSYTNVSEDGKVYVYNTSTHELVTTIISNESSPHWFGTKIEASGNYLAISEDGGSVTNNRVHLYEIDSITAGANPTPIRVFVNPSPSGTADFFGNDIAISGDYIAISANYDDAGGTRRGRVYVYRISSGTSPIHTLSGDQDNAQFGISIAITNTLLVVGAYVHDANGDSGAGVAYVYDVVSGAKLRTLLNPLSDTQYTNLENFGESVAVYGDYVFVGCPRYDDASTDQGRVYVYKISAGTTNDAYTIAPLYAIENPLPGYGGNGVLKDAFGGSDIVVNSKYVAVGAQYQENTSDNTSSPLFTSYDAGKVYIFDIRSGDHIHTFDAINPSNSLQWGESLSMDEDYLVIGAGSTDSPSTDAGKSYTFAMRDLINLDKVMRRVS